MSVSRCFDIRTIRWSILFISCHVQTLETDQKGSVTSFVVLTNPRPNRITKLGNYSYLKWGDDVLWMWSATWRHWKKVRRRSIESHTIPWLVLDEAIWLTFRAPTGRNYSLSKTVPHSENGNDSIFYPDIKSWHFGGIIISNSSSFCKVNIEFRLFGLGADSLVSEHVPESTGCRLCKLKFFKSLQVDIYRNLSVV